MSLYGRIRVTESQYCRIFYALSSQHRLKAHYSFTSLNVRSFCLSITIMFSRIFHRLDTVNQVNSEEEAAIELGSASLKRKTENAELSNFIKSRDKTSERGLGQVLIHVI